MTTIHFDPASEFDVPAGTYSVRFEGLVDKEPFENSRYARPGEPPEPRWGWRFRVLGGEQDGKVIEEVTGRKATRKARLTQLLSWLMGGNLQPGTDVRVEDLVGRTYRLVWAPNPNSEKGNNHIAHLEPAAAGGNGAAAADAPPPPPRAKRPATPAASEGAEFWVDVGEGRPPVKKSRSAVEEMIREGGLDADALQVQEVGKPATGWMRASECGFEGPIPF
jgi:hypothetical protein